MKILLVVAMVVANTFSPMQYIHASNTTPVHTTVQKNTSSKSGTTVGDIEVAIPLAIPLKAVPSASMNLTMKILWNGGTKSIPLGSGTENGDITIGSTTVPFVMKATQKEDMLSAIHVTLKGLPQDSYTIELKGSGFSSVTHKVDVKDYSKLLTFTNTETFLFGDTNNDKQVNETDYQGVLKAIDTTDVEKIKQYDLNRDRVVDIEDLNTVAKNVGVLPQKAVENVTGVIINLDEVTIESPADTSIRDANNMFKPDATTPTKLSLQNTTNKISETTPVSVDVNFDSDKLMSKIEITSPQGDSSVAKGEIVVEDNNGQLYNQLFKNATRSGNRLKSSISDARDVIVIDLGKQVAVKKITIKITDTSGPQKNLAEIAKVEFLNDVYASMPEKEIAFPKNVEVLAGSEEIAVSWDSVRNIEGYEVKYVFLDPKTNKNKTVKVRTQDTKLVLESLNNFTTYTISVQSISGERWESGFGPSVTATPMPSQRPNAPEDVTGSGEYKKINIKWSKNKNAVTYNVYYKLESAQEYSKTEALNSTSTSIPVKEEGNYLAYVTATNVHGESSPSKTVAIRTAELKLPELYNYKLINRSNGEGVPASAITSVRYVRGNVDKNQFDITDNDPLTSWKYNGWDTGGFNEGIDGSPIVEFDKTYMVKEVIIVPSFDQRDGISYVKAKYWSDDPNENPKRVNGSIGKYKDKNNRDYYLVKLDRAVEAKKLQINLGLYLASGKTINVSEMRFYEYDSIEEDVNAVYTDDLHLTLRNDVDAAYLEALQTRLDTKDVIADELHPKYVQINEELAYAREILDKQNKTELIQVDQNVSTRNDGNLKFAFSLSALQPLGISARARDELTIYVGADKGASYGLELVFTQFHGTAYAWQSSVRLNKGKNTIIVPDLITTTDEHGGALYLRYTNGKPTGDAANKKIQVRVNGGYKTPFLDLTGMKDGTKVEAMQKIDSYVATLDTYVNQTLPDLYKDTTFDSRSSVLNTTEIMTDKGLLSIPADSVWNTIAKKPNKSDTLYQNALALEQFLRMAYTSKGLVDTQDNSRNAMPMTRINMRFSTMFDGAFMFAAGGHIGVPYEIGSTLVTGTPFTKAPGAEKYSGGDLFGWGIGHEVGHVIDGSGMIYGETSNNVISLLSQTFGETGESRIGSKEKMKTIYAKVTSGTKGLSSDVFTTLGMFWQLHLAYDNTYISPENVSPFFQKLYTEHRKNTEKLDSDNLLIRLASDAAEKDLTEFFERWGLEANPETLAYIKSKGYPKETRDIFYISEKARYKRIEGSTPMANDTAVEASLKREVDQTGNEFKKVTINLGITKDSDKILGYEIKRNGKVVGFTSDATFVDSLGSLNNRVFTYEVTAYDYLLNKTPSVTLESIKVKHDGSMPKDTWTITSNVDADKNIEGGDTLNTRLNALINQDYSDTYTGTARDKESNVQFILGLDKIQSVAGVKFTAALDGDTLAPNTPKKYTVEVSEDRKSWKNVATGDLKFTKDQFSKIIYFSESTNADENQLGIFNAAHVRITFAGKNIALSELDVLAPPGDNVELIENGIGLLKNAYTYAPGKSIPRGSLVFNGKYRGNPAFNAVLLFDENGKNVVGKDLTVNSIILAQLPTQGELYEVSDGNWIYWIEPGQFDEAKLPKKVKAELFRVDDPATLEGQRFVSDTLHVTLPERLPEIELKGQEGN